MGQEDGPIIEVTLSEFLYHDNHPIKNHLKYGCNDDLMGVKKRKKEKKNVGSFINMYVGRWIVLIKEINVRFASEDN